MNYRNCVRYLGESSHEEEDEDVQGNQIDDEDVAAPRGHLLY